ncbi:uncharacterized protein LOC129326893 [Eublepharis macularius]|uniref:Uncharacterized protein LOC129326893 n=1 Tax=Eublepharis macularius TaxID=481883 RepID=A0AA97J442_EUBMA|nr:uncharacterized protein LOC129326893 [Eublepharis macularius]
MFMKIAGYDRSQIRGIDPVINLYGWRESLPEEHPHLPLPVQPQMIFEMLSKDTGARGKESQQEERTGISLGINGLQHRIPVDWKKPQSTISDPCILLQCGNTGGSFIPGEPIAVVIMFGSDSFIPSSPINRKARLWPTNGQLGPEKRWNLKNSSTLVHHKNQWSNIRGERKEKKRKKTSAQQPVFDDGQLFGTGEPLRGTERDNVEKKQENNGDSTKNCKMELTHQPCGG